jgi:hypothetical protein
MAERVLGCGLILSVYWLAWQTWPIFWVRVPALAMSLFTVWAFGGYWFPRAFPRLPRREAPRLPLAGPEAISEERRHIRESAYGGLSRKDETR